jgi:hypothetical protein
MSPTDLRPLTDVNMLHVCSCHADGHDILGLAGGGAGMATDAASMVDDFRPLHAIGVRSLLVDHVYEAANISEGAIRSQYYLRQQMGREFHVDPVLFSHALTRMVLTSLALRHHSKKSLTGL